MGTRKLFILALFVLILFFFINDVQTGEGREQEDEDEDEDESERERGGRERERYQERERERQREIETDRERLERELERESERENERGEIERKRYRERERERERKRDQERERERERKASVNERVNAHDLSEKRVEVKKEETFPVRFLIKDLSHIFVKLLQESNSAFNQGLAQFLIELSSGKVATDHAMDNAIKHKELEPTDKQKNSVKKHVDIAKESKSNLKIQKETWREKGEKLKGKGDDVGAVGNVDNGNVHQTYLPPDTWRNYGTIWNQPATKNLRLLTTLKEQQTSEPPRGSGERIFMAQLIFGLIISLMVICSFSICYYYGIHCWCYRVDSDREFINSFEFHIDFSHLKVIQRLGNGNFTHVYLVDYQQCDSKAVQAAAKLLVPEILNQDGPSVLADSIRCSVDEIILRKLKHKNIVNMYGICTNFEIPAQISTSLQSASTRKYKTIATILEYMELGNCDHFFYLRSENRQLENPFHVLFLILLDVISAFIYLGHHRIVHRDLATRNILLTLTDNDDCTIKNRLVAKVADFGLAKKGEKSPLCKFWAYIGSGQENLDERIMAPEAKEKSLFSSASDVYAFGMFIWVLIEYASTCKSEQGALVEDVDGNIQPITPCGYSSVIPIIMESNNFASNAKSDLQMVAKLCFEPDMDHRITFKELEKRMEILAANYQRDLTVRYRSQSDA